MVSTLNRTEMQGQTQQERTPVFASADINVGDMERVASVLAGGALRGSLRSQLRYRGVSGAAHPGRGRSQGRADGPRRATHLRHAAVPGVFP